MQHYKRTRQIFTEVDETAAFSYSSGKFVDTCVLLLLQPFKTLPAAISITSS